MTHRDQHRLVILACMCLAVVIPCTFIFCGCAPRLPTEAAQQDSPFISAFTEGRYEDALAIADGELSRNPGDPTNLVYRGTCLALMGQPVQAVEAFFLGCGRDTPLARDKTVLYLRALSLFDARMYLRARATIDQLMFCYPGTRLAEKGQALAIRVGKALAGGVRQIHVNWYLEEGLKNYGKGHPALTLEYLEEYLLLAEMAPRDTAIDRQKAALAMGGASIELGNAARALHYLLPLPTAYDGHKAGIMTAFATRLAGRNDEATALMQTASTEAPDTATRTMATSYLEDWSRKEGEPR